MVTKRLERCYSRSGLDPRFAMRRAAKPVGPGGLYIVCMRLQKATPWWGTQSPWDEWRRSVAEFEFSWGQEPVKKMDRGYPSAKENQEDRVRVRWYSALHSGCCIIATALATGLCGWAAVSVTQPLLRVMACVMPTLLLGIISLELLTGQKKLLGRLPTPASHLRAEGKHGSTRWHEETAGLGS